MGHHHLKHGLDIPIAGGASGAPVDMMSPPTVGIDPRELRGFIPRLDAREGDRVKRGQKVFHHKFNERLAVVAPVSGTVKAVNRGKRRVITSFVITPDGDDVVQHRTWSATELASISRDDALGQMLDGGVFPLLRTRPLDHVADPDDTPQAILICGTATGPLEGDAAVLMSADDNEALQAGVNVLAALTDGTVHLSTTKGASHAAFEGLTGVTTHEFSGPHPSGDPAVQISMIDAPRAGQKVWYLHAWDAVLIGRLFLTGQYDGTRTYAAVGAALSTPRFVRTVQGAPASWVAGDTSANDVRWIRGTVLTGATIAADEPAGFYTRVVHALPEAVDRYMFGWAMPALSRWSFHKAFLKAWGGGDKTYDLRPGIYGGHRAIVPVGYYNDVVATPDIVPDFLFKAIIAGDLERSIKLGMLDISEEEAALCSYICPSKIDFDVILREGLENYAKEM